MTAALNLEDIQKRNCQKKKRERERERETIYIFMLRNNQEFFHS